MRSAGDAERIDRLLVSGGSARVPGLAEFLAQRHQVPVEVVNPVSKLMVDAGLFNGESPETVAPILTVAIGLALR